MVVIVGMNLQRYNALMKSLTKASRINALTQVILYTNSGMTVVEACKAVGMPCSLLISPW
jgi:hypothetical protein